MNQNLYRPKDDKKYIRDGRAPIPEKESTSRVMSANKGKNTNPELTLRKALFQNGMRGYRVHWKIVPGSPDIAYPGKRIAIFVNGCFWHRCPYCNPSYPKTNVEFWSAKFKANQERDKKKNYLLENDGWKEITIWECKIKNDLTFCLNQIKSHLDQEDH
jgi:DNA mismatch endonuclease, patch repair protein